MLIRDCWIKCRSKTYIAFEGIRLKGSEKIACARSGECSFSSTIRTNSHIGMICFNLITHRSAFYVSNNINKCWWITNNSHKRQPSSSWSRRGKCANIFSLHNTHNPSRMHLDFRLLYQGCAHGSPAWFILIRYSNGKRKKATMPLWWLHHFDFLHWRWLHALMTMVASASGLFVLHKTEKNHARIFDWQNLKIRQIQKYLTQQNPSLVLSNLVKCPSNCIIHMYLSRLWNHWFVMRISDELWYPL